MRHGFSGAIAAALVAAPIVAAAQVSALPRTSDGRPNLQGIWQVMNTVAWDIQDHQARLGEPAGQGVGIEPANISTTGVDGGEIVYENGGIPLRDGTGGQPLQITMQREGDRLIYGLSMF